MDPALAQVIVGVLGLFTVGGVVDQVLKIRRARHTAGPLNETAARLDIVAQLEQARAARGVAEHDRDAANGRAAAAGQRATTAEHLADVWERYAYDVRESCLAHGTPLNLLPPRPQI